MPNVIRLGDPTDHGGKVIATGAPPRFTVDGIPVALLGDACSCPKHGHSHCTIAQGDRESVLQSTIGTYTKA